jgi:hypothetical protein
LGIWKDGIEGSDFRLDVRIVLLTLLQLRRLNLVGIRLCRLFFGAANRKNRKRR